jgi:hypothetical protein
MHELDGSPDERLKVVLGGTMYLRNYMVGAVKEALNEIMSENPSICSRPGMERRAVL